MYTCGQSAGNKSYMPEGTPKIESISKSDVEYINSRVDTAETNLEEAKNKMREMNGRQLSGEDAEMMRQAEENLSDLLAELKVSFDFSRYIK